MTSGAPRPSADSDGDNARLTADATHRLELSGVLGTVIDDRVEGLPGGVRPFTLDRIASHGWNVLHEDLPLPVMVLKRSALHSNLELMREFCERSGVDRTSRKDDYGPPTLRCTA